MKMFKKIMFAIFIASCTSSATFGMEFGFGLEFGMGNSGLYVEKGLDTKAILMGSGDLIEMTLNNDNKSMNKSIFSFGFCGCTGVGCFVLYKNGQQKAFLTHYSPISNNAHVNKIKSLCSQFNPVSSENPIEKCVVIIMHPLVWQKNSKTGFYDIRAPKDPELVKLLSDTVSKQLQCKSIELNQELYSECMFMEERSPGCMFGDSVVPKDFEIVLASNAWDSYFQSKASDHNQKFVNKK